MDRRELLAGLGASVLTGADAVNAQSESKRAPTYLELKVWRLHNTPENQGARLSAYLKDGLTPALARTDAKLVGAFSTVIGPDSPSYISVTQFPSLAAMEATIAKLKADEEHHRALEKLGEGPGLPFVRVESSLLRSFDILPEPAILDVAGRPGRIFELRTYESQSFLTLTRKVAMFNNAEAQIFERLGFRPVFFGETIVGPRQPNLMYMLSYDNLAARERLWGEFGSSPEWKKLSGQPELKDAEIVANITNVILAPLPFSAVR